MTQRQTDEMIALVKVSRAIDALIVETTRMRHFKGWATELKPLYERELARLNARISALGGRRREIRL